MATKTVRRIVTAGVAGSAALVLAAAPAGASSAAGIGSGDRAPAAGGAAGQLSVTNGTARVNAPGSAYQYQVVTNKCFSTYQLFTVKQIERGKSGVTRFKQTVGGYYLTKGGWVRSGSLKFVQSKSFPNNTTTFTFKFPWKYTYGATAPASHQIRMFLEWKSASGGDIATQGLTQTCR